MSSDGSTHSPRADKRSPSKSINDQSTNDEKQESPVIRRESSSPETPPGSPSRNRSSSPPTPDGSPPPNESSPAPERQSSPVARERSPSEPPREPRSKKSRRDRSGSTSPHERRRETKRKSQKRSKSRSRSPKRTKSQKEPEPAAPPRKEPVDILRTRTGGAYIPPAKLKLMQAQIADKSSEQYQRMNWERLKKKIHGLVNRVNVGNLVQIVRELLQENVIRGKGLLTRSIIQAQAFSPTFSHVYAALVAVINSKFPHIGELLLRRLIVQFKRSFRRNDKGVTINVSKFIAHLINQQVAHEVLALEIMLLMLEVPTDDSVEVAIAFLKECGMKLMEISPAALNSVYDRLRAILMETSDDENPLDKRIRYMIEVAMQIRKEKFAAYPSIVDDLDLIEEDDQITHTLNLEEATNPENELNVFKLDPEFEKNENMYDEIRQEIIGDAEISSDEEEEDDEDDEDAENEGAAKPVTTEIIDNTEQNLVAFRREVYLTIQSSLDYQEAAHKLLKMKVKPELDNELCNMLVDCCAQQRTYERFYGLLIERFCRLRLEYQQTFEQIVRDAYSTVHRFEITKLRNLARLVSHLLYTDAINWTILGDVKMTEEDTTSSGRIYIKYIFQELCEAMGLVKLYERVKDPTLSSAFAGLFPRDNPQNARFSINFFTMIGLGGLTIDLREWLEKGMKKRKEMMEAGVSDTDSSSSSDSSDSDSDDSSDSSDSSDSDSDSDSSDSSDSEDDKKKKNKKSKEVGVSKKNKKSKEAEKENRRHAEKEVKEEPLSDDESRRHRDRRDAKRDNRDRRREKSPDKRRQEDEDRRNGRDEKKDRRHRDDVEDARRGRRDEREERTRDRENGNERKRERNDDRRKRDDEDRSRDDDRKKDRHDRSKERERRKRSPSREETRRRSVEREPRRGREVDTGDSRRRRDRS
ncbi:unnamed protein product [Caenorhabditis auriculariae]|uniref:Lethal protein 858 n=1 Tax=Caenorhabditis auriculariae TaxID=2777116 RepID=A0A8S1HKE8_9PELO|nr:unnamed protein product [Caenorhabditis auriculariae]